MKITFEGKTFQDIAEEMENMLGYITQKIILASVSEKSTSTAVPLTEPAQGPGPVEPSHGFDAPVGNLVDNPVVNPVEKKPKAERTEKQKANDERLRAAAAAKLAEKKAAKDATPPAPVDTMKVLKNEVLRNEVEIVKIRQKTIEDLQQAYANGFQKEVFELLSRFGNGAKSFRELPPDAFVPIREAIDNGALT